MSTVAAPEVIAAAAAAALATPPTPSTPIAPTPAVPVADAVPAESTMDINAKYPYATARRVASAIALRSLSRRAASEAGGLDFDECDERSAFYVVDLEVLVARYQAWRATLPCVEPYYAVKCNPSPVLLRVLSGLGTCFDCASSDEMDRVRALGVGADRIIFANPCKAAPQIAHARRVGVKLMTFDNEDELVKVARVYPDAELVLRIATDDAHSLCRFSSKFGAPMDAVPHLLATAARLGLRLVGVSYHVGSGCADAACHGAAAADALRVFQLAAQYGYQMNLLDIGGGFLGEDDANPSLADVALHLLPVLAQFPAGTRFIAEPGRYFVAHSHTLVANIHSRRVVRGYGDVPQHALYYINEGVYHGFNCIMFDHQHPVPRTLLPPATPELAQRPTVLATVFGPTCDSLDCVCKAVPMPLLEVGEWLFFADMGAYTSAAATHFNGFDGAECHYMWGDTHIDPALLDEFLRHPALSPAPDAAAVATTAAVTDDFVAHSPALEP